eukprot:CAMPEP_0181251896 /NCGR_PEP_ID=MMETSP1096-20121128/47152_1 /TAXON_ID=156174 ORGANISM="Chrysochromulina ericina, Strain CCMP281" /NCGR_SAMPLE_ID=MMETSP1096 /ASSEMBLY_ACC=CAM_ASM_000453 /LENGTH=80 /DNA_ID=CAMNT_0023349571 /DNA_START=20 /DNA_END=258 /DNA_ORIENTATION=+
MNPPDPLRACTHALEIQTKHDTPRTRAGCNCQATSGNAEAGVSCWHRRQAIGLPRDARRRRLQSCEHAGHALTMPQLLVR